MRPRITKDDLKYCRDYKKCCDCYIKGKDIKAIRFQRRGKRRIPCCQEDFDNHKRKLKQVNALKYARRAARKQKTGLCVSNGCQRPLIPPELLPSWLRGERTCGTHGVFKQSRDNRIALANVIIENYLSAEQRKDMRLQNIIYKRRRKKKVYIGLIFIGMQYPGHYTTQIWSVEDVQNRHDEIHSPKKSPRRGAVKTSLLQ